MAIETTIYTPRTLGKLITRMPPVHTFFRDTLFKNRRTFPTKSVDVDFKKGSRALAPFRSPESRWQRHGLRTGGYQGTKGSHPRSAGP